MDSRIVACVLKDVLEAGAFKNKKVIGLTWGYENSRDVVYAKRICRLFNWDWEHLSVDVEQMWMNIRICMENGCEYTPIHLHAMPIIAERKDIDCVLAGSFGDSVGRAEYSGTKVSNLVDIRNAIKNPYNILRSDFNVLSKSNTNTDVDGYHKQFPQSKPYMLYEQDQQLHYMRKMLNSCMSVINKKIPLYQMFSSPAIFGYMWSLDPVLRTNKVYEIILSQKTKNY
ncbi:hypothetical protein MKP09_12815 [Niabella ginsengisoli]|uniref:Uncharacterized protein n=2 Tax=Niabella ginsengisoli TaxID=522298 RepID=A0ABS9SK60_9BACT|nr:hypothetical protein [Niabella ginsengisoli]